MKRFALTSLASLILLAGEVFAIAADVESVPPATAMVADPCPPALAVRENWRCRNTIGSWPVIGDLAAPGLSVVARKR